MKFKKTLAALGLSAAFGAGVAGSSYIPDVKAAVYASKNKITCSDATDMRDFGHRLFTVGTNEMLRSMETRKKMSFEMWKNLARNGFELREAANRAIEDLCTGA